MSSSSAVEHPTLKHSSHTRGASLSQHRLTNLVAPSSSNARPTSSRINRNRNGSIGTDHTPMQLRRLSEHHIGLSGIRNDQGETTRNIKLEDDGSEMQEETMQLKRDIEAYEVALNLDGNGNNDDHVNGEILDVDDPRKIGYDGPFQPPVGKETLGIIFSVLAVLLLALAAGLTTVFDWVL